MKDSIWENNSVQFPRLLAEMRAAGIPDELMQALCESMDLTPDKINEILERADQEFDRIKPRPHVTQLFPIRCYFKKHGDERFNEKVWFECVGIFSKYFDHLPGYRGHYSSWGFNLPLGYMPIGKTFAEISEYESQMKASENVEIIKE
jgi:hypothetical protein